MTQELQGLLAMIRRAQETVGGISIERMGGDNLAVTLCSHFDDGAFDEDENGWTEAATAGYEETVKAIRDHYAPVFDALLASLTAKDAEIAALRAALAWYADQFCEFGTSNEGCGKFGDDVCAGCKARGALHQNPESKA